MTPKVVYDIIAPDKEAGLFYDFLGGGPGRWDVVFDRVYPELRPMIASAKDRAEALDRCKTFAAALHAYNKEDMETARGTIQSAWDAVGPEFLRLLADHFETAWPDEHPTIVGHVSSLPVFPRFLDTFSFCLGYKDVSTLIEISAHEILHFLWFKKWAEVFPDMGPDTYQSPHLVWRLSEIMDPIILQCHPQIQRCIKPKKWGYSSFAQITIGEVSMTEFFRDLYEKAMASRASFEQVLRLLWGAAQQHEAEISAF